jgi:hypothetical protein
MLLKILNAASAVCKILPNDDIAHEKKCSLTKLSECYCSAICIFHSKENPKLKRETGFRNVVKWAGQKC